jgi:hypothetical protein
MNRFYTILIVSVLFASSVSAQKLDYEDVYASLKTSKDFEVYQVLMDYQKAYPYFANTYYQLGLICQKWMRQYDPFLQTEEVRENIKNAGLFFSLCLTYCDESDVRKNKEYYREVQPAKGEEFASFILVQQDIKSRMKDVEIFKKYHNLDVRSLVNCVSKYNLSISIFRDINMQNSRLKDLYFLPDKIITTKLNELKLNFDSAIFYFNALNSQLKEYPLGNYNPAYKLAAVDVYRLHGLTPSNFLNNEVVLWDFGSWVNSFRIVLTSDIAELNRKAGETDKLHTEFVSRLKQKDILGIPRDYQVNPALLNKIYKYDFKSALGKLFEYQEMKINYLQQYAVSAKNVNDSLMLRVSENKADYYYQLSEYKQHTDSLLTILKLDATEAEINKYSAFFQEHYNGHKGLLQYIDNQKTDNDIILKSTLEDYMNTVISELKTDTIPKILKYKKITINLNLVKPDQIRNDGYFVFSKTGLPGREVIISGSSFTGNSEASAFVAVIDSTNTIKWLRTYRPGQASQYGLIAKPAGDGILLVMVSKTQKSQYLTMLLLDKDGNVKTTKEINTPYIPRKVLYDDINQSAFLACKGYEFGQFSLSEDSLGVYVFDANLSVVWNKKFWFDGYLSEVLKINNQFLIFGAYNRLNSIDGKDFTLSNGILNLFLSVLDAEGNCLQTTTYPAAFSYYPLKIVKINSDFIDVISVKEKRPDDILQNENIMSTLHYLITTTKGNDYFSF